MAQAPSVTLDPIKYLKTLPEFNGTQHDLYNFITLIDRIHPVLTQYDQMSQLFFSDIIKSRLQGRAREIIEINFHVQSWAEIKNVLINNFGERLNLEELYDNMRAVVFRTNTTEFYNEIKDRLRRLNNKTNLIMGDNPGTAEIAKNNMKSALNIFKAKIPEPMKTILTCRNPDTLEEAMEILFQAGYAYNGNKIRQTENEPRNRNFNKQNYKNDNRYNSNSQRPNLNSQYKHNFNSNNYNRQNIQHRPNYNSQENYPRQNFQYRPHNNSNQQRNYNSPYNTPNISHQQSNQPEPMDVNTFQNIRNQPTYENFQFPASQENYRI